VEQVKYTQKDILERAFKTKRVGTGYDPADVDGFLDDIIKDYGAYNENVKLLQDQVDKLQAALKQTQEQLVAAKQAQTQDVKPAPAPSAPVVEEVAAPAPKPVTNLDLLKRVANLERAVFGKTKEEAEAAQD
jgi:DivIVA domain-containing protein